MAREMFLVPDVVSEPKVELVSYETDESEQDADQQTDSYRIQTACEALGV